MHLLETPLHSMLRGCNRQERMKFFEQLEENIKRLENSRGFSSNKTSILTHQMYVSARKECARMLQADIERRRNYLIERTFSHGRVRCRETIQSDPHIAELDQALNDILPIAV